MPDGETKVQFSLWAVLAALVVAAIILFGDLYIGQRNGQKANADVCDRVTVLETASRLQFEEIRAWRKDVKEGMDKIADKIDKHTSTAAVVKRWQDYPASRGE